jgi:hypothetical protein
MHHNVLKKLKINYFRFIFSSVDFLKICARYFMMCLVSEGVGFWNKLNFPLDF